MKVGGGLEEDEEEEEEEDVQPDVSHSRSMRHAFRCLSFSTIAGSDFFFIQYGHFTGSYGLKETTLCRPPI